MQQLIGLTESDPLSASTTMSRLTAPLPFEENLRTPLRKQQQDESDE